MKVLANALILSHVALGGFFDDVVDGVNDVVDGANDGFNDVVGNIPGLNDIDIPSLNDIDIPSLNDIDIPGLGDIPGADIVDDMIKCVMPLAKLDGPCAPVSVLFADTFTSLIQQEDGGKIEDITDSTINAICSSGCISSIPQKSSTALKCVKEVVAGVVKKNSLLNMDDIMKRFEIDDIFKNFDKVAETAEKLMCSKTWFDGKACTRFVKDVVASSDDICEKAKCCVGTIAEAFDMSPPCGGISACPAPGQSSKVASFSFSVDSDICDKLKTDLSVLYKDTEAIVNDVISSLEIKIDDSCSVEVKYLVSDDFSGVADITNKFNDPDAFPSVTELAGVDFSATVQGELQTVSVPKSGNSGSIALPSLLLTSLLMFIGSQN